MSFQGTTRTDPDRRSLAHPVLISDDGSQAYSLPAHSPTRRTCAIPLCVGYVSNKRQSIVADDGMDLTGADLDEFLLISPRARFLDKKIDPRASEFYKVPNGGVRVLAARPLRVRENRSSELFGDYTPETMLSHSRDTTQNEWYEMGKSTSRAEHDSS